MNDDILGGTVPWNTFQKEKEIDDNDSHRIQTLGDIKYHSCAYISNKPVIVQLIKKEDNFHLKVKSLF